MSNEEVLRTTDDQAKLEELYKKSKPTICEYIFARTKDMFSKDQSLAFPFWKVLIVAFIDTISMTSIEILSYRKRSGNEPSKEAEFIYNHQLKVFLAACLIFDIPMPKNLNLFQNELIDSLDVLNNLPSTDIIQLEEHKRINDVIDFLDSDKKENLLTWDDIIDHNNLKEFIKTHHGPTPPEEGMKYKLTFSDFLGIQVQKLPSTQPMSIRLNNLFFMLVYLLNVYGDSLLTMRLKPPEELQQEEEKFANLLIATQFRQRTLFLCIQIIFGLPGIDSCKSIFNELEDDFEYLIHAKKFLKPNLEEVD